MSRPDPDEIDRGVQTARAIYAMRRGPRGAAASLVSVACEHCGASPWDPCVALGSGRVLAAVHPSRAVAASRRDESTPTDDLESEHR